MTAVRRLVGRGFVAGIRGLIRREVFGAVLERELLEDRVVVVELPYGIELRLAFKRGDAVLRQGVDARQRERNDRRYDEQGHAELQDLTFVSLHRAAPFRANFAFILYHPSRRRTGAVARSIIQVKQFITMIAKQTDSGPLPL